MNAFRGAEVLEVAVQSGGTEAGHDVSIIGGCRWGGGGERCDRDQHETRVPRDAAKTGVRAWTAHVSSTRPRHRGNQETPENGRKA